MLTVIAIVVALFFAMNIGASGAAASMGVAYGSGAVEKKRVALIVVAVGVMLGAVIGGGEVVRTMGSGIIPTHIVSVEVVVIILASATLTLFGANLLGIPLSTSEVTVGAIVGVGVAFQALYVNSILIIVGFWIVVPIVAFFIAFICGKAIKRIETKYPLLRGQGKWRKWLVVLVIFTGFMEAFSAGMNNVANAVGPLVGAGIMGETQGIWIGALFVAIGAIFLGGKVLETNGKKITKLSLLQGSAVSGTGGILVIIASLFGIPVPLTQVTTTAILGIGTADKGFLLWQKGIIAQIIKVWIVSPILSLVVANVLIHAWLRPDPYVLIVIVCVLISTIGTMSLYQTIRKERRSIHEEGGGI